MWDLARMRWRDEAPVRARDHRAFFDCNTQIRFFREVAVLSFEYPATAAKETLDERNSAACDPLGTTPLR